MKYKQGCFGRVFLLKFEGRGDLLEEIKRVAVQENIKVGTIMLLGGMRTAGVVTGPKKSVIPPDPVWTNVSDGREVMVSAPSSGGLRNPSSISTGPWAGFGRPLPDAASAKTAPCT